MTAAQPKTVIIVQARMTSRRLPGKVLAEVAGRPVIALILERVRQAKTVDEVWLACSSEAADDPLAAVAEALGVPVFRGDENDVMSRFVAVARQTDAQVVVRITGDCPLADPGVIDRVVGRFHQGGADFVSNTLQRSFPDGLDVEVFSRAALERADREATDPFLRLHVSPYIHGRLKDRLPAGDFVRAQVVNDADFSHLRFTLDEADDLVLFRELVPALPAGFGWMDAVSELTRRPDLLYINRAHKLHEGTERDLASRSAKPARSFVNSNALLERATRSIPLATQTFSKSYMQFAKGAAPLFIERGRGARVWDVDHNEYIDYILGLLPVVLGHCDPDVDTALRRQLERGISFSLATELETELAERLIRLIPCAEKVRFGKNGSDATTAAIRLARAHTGRHRVALCGYHGWHDWYIGTTSRDLGVPDEVKELSATFPYNDADALAKLLEEHPNQFAAVILEAAGTKRPEPGFLERLRELTEKHGVVLIFDEVVTGFRINMGGAQAEFGVTPDLACFGKAMGNGLPISALVGRNEVMARMTDIFFSATFGGEALSLAGSIATIDKLEREAVLPRLRRLGGHLMEQANRIFDQAGFGGILSFSGEDWWPRIGMTNLPVAADLMTTLLRQEFAANGLLLGASFNLSLAHDNEEVVSDTLERLDRSVRAVRTALDSGDPTKALRGALVQPVFSVR